ncbi:MAG TPA: methyltransferase domain-containing protein [Streptosporangiaceae bacterium]|nr:methyltransferase domain-containing protein [Streptosporangiaceae bacterium]
MGAGFPPRPAPAKDIASAQFRPSGQEDLAPSGAASRVRANIAALATLRTIQAEVRPATPEEQRVLARWSGWGAVPEVFDSARSEFAQARHELGELLSSEELKAAARNTLNAHYTDAAIVEAVWSAVREPGFTGGRVLEPGCGSGNFIGLPPAAAELTGVELDPVTAAIAALLYPQAEIRAESFADTRERDGCFDLVIGNVPLGKVVLHRVHNAAGHSIHNHFVVKSVRLARPGGLVACLTSRYTMDSRNPAARREIASLADLPGRSGWRAGHTSGQRARAWSPIC